MVGWLQGVTEEVLEGLMTEQMRGLLLPPFTGSPGRPDHFNVGGSRL